MRSIRRWARECFEEVGMLGGAAHAHSRRRLAHVLSLERRMVHIRSRRDRGRSPRPRIAYLEPLALDAPVANR